MWARNKIASSLKCAPRNDRDAVVIARRAQPDEAISKIRYTNVPCDLGYRSGITHYTINITQSILLIVVSFLFLATSAYAATAIYRSIAPSATGALATGASGTLSVSGSTATFSSALPDNVGVGDAIQYDSDNNGSIDAVCFVHGRTDSTHYTVKKADGSAPTATSAADSDWAAYRAYTSLANAESAEENDSLSDTVENFDTWSGGKDLVTADEQWNIACYANGTGSDRTPVAIDGWTTDSTRYLRVYTPVAASEVGVSQRHSGKWDNAKYKIELGETWSSTLIAIYDNNVKIDGLQLHTTDGGYNFNIYINNITNGSAIFISNNIIRDSGCNQPIEFNGGSGTSYVYVYNNIIYDFTCVQSRTGTGIAVNNWNGSATLYAYNNTIYNCNYGLDRYGTTNFIAKNNILKSCVTAASGTFAAGTDYNATDNASMGYTVTGGGNLNDRTSQTFTFVDESIRNLHLAGGDAGARRFGVDLSGDPNLPFSTDVDGAARPTNKWDIGADQATNVIYRSVGPSATSPLASGPAYTLTIVGSTATFGNNLPENVGVGDAIQYDSDNNGSVDAICFIIGRTDASHYTVRTASDQVPAAAAGDTDWALYRAYTSLYNAESAYENDSINDTVENFDTWTDGRDLVTNGEIWNIACYANDTNADTANVRIEDWTTSASNYLRIYTPVGSSEVGVSQRHSGKWDEKKYHMNRTAPWDNASIVYTSVGWVYIDGLQIKGIYTNRTGGYIVDLYPPDATAVYVFNNIVTGVISGTSTGQTGIRVAYFESPGTRVAKIWNNTVYDLINGSNDLTGISIGHNGWSVCYGYNNTVYNNYNGIYVPQNTVIAKNNISYNNTDNYVQSFDPSSTNNLSGPAQTDAPGSNPQNGVSVSFINAANRDLHLALGDTGARRNGFNLSEDANLAFSNDIDGELRPSVWDIGADQSKQPSSVKNAVVRKGTIR